MDNPESLHKDVTSRILEAAIEVHRVLGPGFLEGVYEEALAHEFNLREIRFDRQKVIAVPYKDITAGEGFNQFCQTTLDGRRKTDSKIRLSFSLCSL